MAIGVEIQDLTFKAAEQADKLEIQADGGGLGSSFYTTVDSIVEYFNNSGAAGVQTIVAGTNVVVDATDAAHPIVNVPDIGVESVSAGQFITINNTDPAHPVISGVNQLANLGAGDSIEIDTTTPNAPIINLSDTIKGGSLNLVTIYENGSGTLGIGNLSTGAIQIGNGATATIAIRNLLWPTADGNAGEVLTTDGAGTLSFQANSGGQVNSVVAGDSIGVDNTDPENPVVFLQDIIKENSVSPLITIYNNGIGTISIGSGTGGNVIIGSSKTAGSVSIGGGLSGSGSVAIGFGATSDISIRNLLWPVADGGAGDVLTTDGAGTLSFQPASGGSLDFQEDGVAVLSSATANFITNFTVTDNAGVADIAHNPDANMAFNDDFGVTFGANGFISNDTVSGTFHINGGTEITQISGTSVYLASEPSGSGILVGPIGTGINALSTQNITLQSTASGGAILLNSANSTITISPSSVVGGTFYTESLGTDDSIVWLGFDGTPMVTVDSSGILLEYARWPAADGTAGQVITTDGAGNLSFETPATPSLRLLGHATVELGLTQSIPNNTPTAVNWQTPTYDPLSTWSIAHPSRIVVPAGTNFIRASFMGVFLSNPTGWRGALLRLNGSLPVGRGTCRNSAIATETIMDFCSGYIPVTPGDVLTVEVQQTSGGDLAFTTVTGGPWFMVEFFEDMTI